MDEQKQRLAARRGAMVAGGFWRDETLLYHLARAVAVASVEPQADTGLAPTVSAERGGRSINGSGDWRSA